MLERCTAADGRVVYRSPLLARRGVAHFFGTRGGPGGRVLAAHERETDEELAALAGRPGARLAHARQVHGARVVEGALALAAEGALEADALVTGSPELLVLVRVADCVPVLLADAAGARVAAVHAGWRGLVAGVLAEAVRALGGAPPLAAAVGPCLSAARFEIGPEVAAAFVAAGLGPALRPRAGARPCADLRHAAALQLARAGVLELEGTDRCTWEDAAQFFSYRRDVTHGGAPSTGRMLAVIGARA